jgi:hypothetical protein
MGVNLQLDQLAEETVFHRKQYLPRSSPCLPTWIDAGSSDLNGHFHQSTLLQMRLLQVLEQSSSRTRVWTGREQMER